MANFYLDIETTGFDFEKDKIITIQFQQIDMYGKPYGELTILKEWESSEEEIVKKFHKLFITENVWDFIPYLTNHIFDLSFLFSKFKKYKLPHKELSEFLFGKPMIDIKPILIICNKCSFKGSGLDQITNKELNGSSVPDWYKNKEYARIESYIKKEAESFIEFFNYCYALLPSLKTLCRR